MFTPCLRDNWLLKVAVVEHFQTLCGITVGNSRSGLGAKLRQSTFGGIKTLISQIIDDVCFNISKDYSFHPLCVGQIHEACNKRLSKQTQIQQDSVEPWVFVLQSELNSYFSSEES